MLRHDIRGGASLNAADIQCDAPRVIRQGLDLDREAGNTLAGGDNLSAVAGGFGDQYILGIRRLGLDQWPRARAADLLIGGVEESQRKGGPPAGLDERAIGSIGQIGAALHIVDARSVGAIPLNPKRKMCKRAFRVDGVEMTQRKNARPVTAPGRADRQVIAGFTATRDALDSRAGLAKASRYPVHQPINT